MVSDALHSFCILQCSGSSILAAIKQKLWPKGLNHTIRIADEGKEW
jgi:hypothetical protein